MVQVGVESEDGWRPAKATADLLEWIIVPGTNVHLQVMKGDPLWVMRAYAADYNAYVEPLRDADSASFTPTNSVATSNHLNGTAMDLNWNSHAFRVSYAGFSPQQIAVMRELLSFYEGMMFWAQDWDNPKDCMHHQMGYDTWNNPDAGDFIKRKIRSDGFSTFRRGASVPVSDAAPVLARATALNEARARAILPAVSDGLRAADCTNANRIAMWLAQIGHESDNFNATEEYENGDETTDRWKYKGRTWIQITWRSNYAGFSQWAFDRGLVPTPTYFVDRPKELAALQWAGLGGAWYWTVARPAINSLCDQQNLNEVTRLINGGYNGLDDRRSRYNRALAMGDALLQLLTGEDDMFTDADRMLLRQIAEVRRKSRSALRWPGEGEVDTCAGFAWSADGNAHVQLVEKLAVEYGDPNSVAMLVAVAACTGDPKFPDRQEDAKLASRILEKVPADAKAVGTSQIQAWLDAEKAA